MRTVSRSILQTGFPRKRAHCWQLKCVAEVDVDLDQSEMLRAMGACLSGSVGEPIVISNTSHGMNRENPQAFNAAVLGFLSSR
jgi:pimeloyl-ACP methyl ester carboxylesterase